MKKIFTSMLAMAALMLPNAASAGNVLVENANDLISEITKVREPGTIDTIYVKWIQGGMNIKTQVLPPSGSMHIIGLPNEETGEKAMVLAEFIQPSSEKNGSSSVKGNTIEDKFSIHFENLILEDFNGVGGNSKHFFNAKDTCTHCIDSLVFKNCEIRNLCRSFFRQEPQSKTKPAGYINYFGMENCQIHYGFTQTNAMPFIYIAQNTTEMVFRNNTFYDLPGLNTLITFAYMTEDTGREVLDFTFENNTVVASPKSTLMNFNGYVAPESSFKVNNNIFLYPYWSDDLNNPGMTDEEIEAKARRNIISTQFGIVEAQNNILEGYKGTTALIDEESGEGEPYDLIENELTMADVPFEWTDFADHLNKNFKIWKGKPIYTAGVDGAPIGDLNNYSDIQIVSVSVNPTIVGSKSATVIVSPSKPVYESGEVITLTANTNGKLNTFKGWSTGETDQTITVTLGEEDLNITATFEELPYVAAWNFQQLEKNNVKLAAPLAPNFGDETLTLNYAKWSVDDEAYVDQTTDAIVTRTNKTGDDIRYCFLMNTAEEIFAQAADGEGHADYAYINIPTAVDSKLMFSAASDNVPYKKYAIEYKTDGDWTKIKEVEVDESFIGKWVDIEAELPAAIVGKPAQVRIKGIESEKQFISADFQELIDLGTNSVKAEFLFVSELYLVKTGAAGINDLTAGKAQNANAPVYNMMGMKVNKNAKGLLIQNGRKFIVK